MGDFRVGTILGFELRIDFSWFVVFFLILWSFTFAVFPHSFPGLGRGAYIAMGVAGTVFFFASLLAHELSHALVARAKNIPVEGITLFIFGGVARTRMEAETPGDEFQIAGVGPLTSVLLSVALWGFAALGAGLGWPVAVVAVARYLAFLNLILAIFNLLPGFPLDGGRILRSLVWKWTGDLDRATRVATTGGSWMGMLVIALGLWETFRGNVLGGLWLVFIGWFLRNAALGSYRQHQVRTLLEGMNAGKAMTAPAETVHPDLTLQELVDEFFLRRRFQSYPVAQNGGVPVGVVTLEQVRRVGRDEWPRRRVRDIMTPAADIVLVSARTPMVRVLDAMQTAQTRQALVVEDGKLQGIITRSDINAWLDRVRQLGAGA